MAFAALPAGVAARAARDPVAWAMAAAGGRALLSRVRVLSWSATARVLIGTTAVDLLVEQRIEPFVRGRADTWLADEGRSTARTVMVERDGAFLVHEGAQTTMPPAQALFQRHQLGAYAYLLLAPAFVSAAGPRRLNAGREGFPPIALALGPDGRIASADYAIAAPKQNAAAVRQHLICAGSVSSMGVRYPRAISIVQDGRPFQRMAITDFSVELA